MGLQVRERRKTRSGGRADHPHHGERGVPLAGGGHFLEHAAPGPASRARRQVHGVPRLDHRISGDPADAADRKGSRRAPQVGREQGLLGSKWLAQHPPIPANRIATDINLDTVNRWGRTTDLGVMGLGKSTADDVVRKVAAEQGRTVHGDPQPDRGSFYRSDMFSMAHVGVPPVAVKGGPDYVGRPKGWGEEQGLDYEQHHYHQPSDEYHGDWDFSGAVQDAQLQLLVGLRLANAPALPTWTPGDEFEAARKSASRR